MIRKKLTTILMVTLGAILILSSLIGKLFYLPHLLSMSLIKLTAHITTIAQPKQLENWPNGSSQRQGHSTAKSNPTIKQNDITISPILRCLLSIFSNSSSGICLFNLFSSLFFFFLNSSGFIDSPFNSYCIQRLIHTLYSAPYSARKGTSHSHTIQRFQCPSFIASAPKPVFYCQITSDVGT